MARRKKCTAEVIAKIGEGLRLGMTHALAAQYAGISEATFYNWVNKSESENSEQCYVEFLETIKEAEAQNAARCLIVIDSAATDGSWQAAAWMLERRHKYQRQAAVQVETKHEPDVDIVDPTGEDGRALVIEHVAQLPEDLILAALNLKNASEAK